MATTIVIKRLYRASLHHLLFLPTFFYRVYNSRSASALVSVVFLLSFFSPRFSSDFIASFASPRTAETHKHNKQATFIGTKTQMALNVCNKTNFNNVFCQLPLSFPSPSLCLLDPCLMFLVVSLSCFVVCNLCLF